MRLKSSVPVLALAITLQIGAVVRADSFGTKVGSFNGVDAFSNGTVGNNSGQVSKVGSYTCGYKWQCVEYTSRYYYVVYGRQIAGGNANTWYANASSKGLKAYSNGGTTKPQVGDVLCSSYSTGHVCIVRAVGPDYVDVVHQNWSNGPADNSKRLAMTVSGGRYTIQAAGSYSWQGWLRK
jgi:hypothetical protein